MSGFGTLLDAADQALYRAKAEGRSNRMAQWLPLLAAG
jgi:PleD family two-component response regulator